MKRLLAFGLLSVSLSTFIPTQGFASDGTLELGTDPLFSGATVVKIQGHSAYVFYASILRSGIVPDATGLVEGESMSCRKYDDKKSATSAPTYLCASKFNFKGKGELVHFDPDKDEVEAIRDANREQQK